MSQTQINRVIIFAALLFSSLMVWMLYYNIYGYSAKADRDEAGIRQSFFKARRVGLTAEAAITRVTRRFPEIKCQKVDENESSLLPGFQGYFCLGRTVVNHIGIGYERMWWIEADDDGRLVGVWQSSRFPIK